MPTQSLLEALSTLPPELNEIINDLVLTPTKPSDYFVLLPLSREHYDKYILPLCRTVRLNARNAERFFYGLGPRFGGMIPTEEQLTAAKVYRDAEELEDIGIDQAEEDLTAAEGDSEEWRKKQVILQDLTTEQQIIEHVPYVRHHKFTTPFIRKYYMVHDLVVNLFIEDSEALLILIDAGLIVKRSDLRYMKNSELFRNLLCVSLCPDLISRYDRTPTNWCVLMQVLLELIFPRNICIHPPPYANRLTNAKEIFKSILNTISKKLSDIDCPIRSITIHGVHIRDMVFDSRVIMVNKMRSFLDVQGVDSLNEDEDIQMEVDEEEASPAAIALAAFAAQQRTAVLQDLRILNDTANIFDPFGDNWDIPDYLTFVPAGVKDFDPVVMLGEDSQRRAQFFGRNDGEPCIACGGR